MKLSKESMEQLAARISMNVNAACIPWASASRRYFSAVILGRQWVRRIRNEKERCGL